MKNILYTIILSFIFSSAYAGSVDGKGVVCCLVCNDEFFGSIFKNYIWFDHGYAYRYNIDGYSIEERKSIYPYKEISTSLIRWNSFNATYSLSRKNLELTINAGRSIPCELIEQKQEIFDRLNEVITQEKKKNKI
tara:strand:- start:153 stop:557 length:405 start_codon:yes stop_codon:yes gene_type:complete